jgi:hypothetical protein
MRAYPYSGLVVLFQTRRKAKSKNAGNRDCGSARSSQGRHATDHVAAIHFRKLLCSIVSLIGGNLQNLWTRFPRMFLNNLRFASLRLPTAIAAGFLFLDWAPPSVAREHQYPVMAGSADDVRLRNQLIALSPSTVSADEARRVAKCAYMTGVELRREWHVVWPPGLQVVLANTGRKKGGLCYQYATELLLRLDSMKLQTLETHWAESFANRLSEHNVIVVTAKGQPFEQGILLDNWRSGGHLIYGPAAADPEYRWTENSAETARRLKMKSIAANGIGGPW